MDTRRTETMAELLVRARGMLPDFDYCRRCHKPIWSVLSVQRGVGPRCELLEAIERAEKLQHRTFRKVEYRGATHLQLVQPER